MTTKKNVPILTLHFEKDTDLELTGVAVRRSQSDKSDIVPLMDRGWLYCGESITFKNDGGVLKVTKFAEPEDP